MWSLLALCVLLAGRYGASGAETQESCDAAEAATSVGPLRAVEKVALAVPTPCTCGVFLSGDFNRGSREPPRSNPALMHEHPDPLPCTLLGNKQCTNHCLELIVKHLPNSPTIVCGTLDRDCYKERAYLFIKNCNDTWTNTYLSAGREFCCKDGQHYKCPVGGLTPAP